MKVVITLILSFFLTQSNAQVQYIVSEAGNCTVIGLSTDVKPTPQTDNWKFFEINTGKLYTASAGVWVISVTPISLSALEDTAESIRDAMVTISSPQVGNIEIGDVTGLQDALDGKQPTGSYLTGITGLQVTNALGFTPYNATNPNSYITSADISGKQNTLVSGTNIKTVNGNSLLGSGDLTVQGTGVLGGSESLAADFTTSSTTAASTNLSFPILANEVYDVIISGTCRKASSNTGLKFAINAPTGCTIKGYQLGGGATLAAPQVPSLISSINTLGATLSTGIGVEVSFQLQFRVVNSTNNGNVTFQCSTVTSNVATVFAGTKMTYIKSSVQ